MNKKAIFLAEEIIKILVAVVCILILVGVAILVYKAFVARSNEPEQAIANLNMINSRIGELEEGASETFKIESPKDWIIVAWPNLGLYVKPSRCSNDITKFCLCICEDVSLVGRAKNEEDEFRDISENCEKYNVCKDIDKAILVENNKIKIKMLTELELSLKEGELELRKI